MEKTIMIDGKPVRFKASGGVMYRYKAQFGRELFADAAALEQVINTAKEKKVKVKRKDGKIGFEIHKEYDLTKLSLECIYNLLWTYAKTADDSIPEPQVWLDTFDVFPVMEIYEQIKDITSQNFEVDRKNG